MSLINENLNMRNVPLLDENTISLAATQDLTGAVTATINGAYVDLGANPQGASDNNMIVVFTVETALTSGGSATVQFQIELDADGSGSGTTVIDSQDFAYGSVPTVYEMAIPAHLALQHVRGNVIVKTAALTAGGIQGAVVRKP